MFLYIVGILIIGCINNLDASESTNNYGVDKNKPLLIDDRLSSDGIQCYCNLPECIETHYMCRATNSSNGGCFSEITNTKSIPSRGCIELLNDGGNNNQRPLCDNEPRKHTKHLTADQNSYSLFLCCREHNCNHIHSMEQTPHKKSKPNITAEFDRENVSGASILINTHNNYKIDKLDPASAAGSLSSNDYNNNNELWFRAATIAVPIFGAIILFILIAFAIRMLKNDGIDGHGTKLSGGGSSTSSGTGCGGLLGGSGQRKINLNYEQSEHLQNIKHMPLLKQSSYSYNNNHNLLLSNVLGDDNNSNNNNNSINNNNNNNNSNSNSNNNSSSSSNFSNSPNNNGNNNNSNLINNNYNISDYKNETQAKKNQLLSLEYSLLPQSCNDPSIKPTNIDIVNNSFSNGNGSGINRATTNAHSLVGFGNGINYYRNVNLNQNSTGHGKDFNDKKVYEKEVLNPVTYWAGKMLGQNSTALSEN